MTRSWRPVRRAISRKARRRSTFLGPKSATTRRPAASRTALRQASKASVSEGPGGASMLVPSVIRAAGDRRAATAMNVSVRAPAAPWRRKSPVYTTHPAEVSTPSAAAPWMEWSTGKERRPRLPGAPKVPRGQVGKARPRAVEGERFQNSPLSGHAVHHKEGTAKIRFLLGRRAHRGVLSRRLRGGIADLPLEPRGAAVLDGLAHVRRHGGTDDGDAGVQERD